MQAGPHVRAAHRSGGSDTLMAVVADQAEDAGRPRQGVAARQTRPPNRQIDLFVLGSALPGRRHLRGVTGVLLRLGKLVLVIM